MRTITTDLKTILDISRLMDEDLGTTGALVRKSLYEMAGGSITDDEVKQYVKDWLEAEYVKRAAEKGMTPEAWKATWENQNDEEDDEYIYMINHTMEAVRLMRAGD